jgi:hypothetical protein
MDESTPAPIVVWEPTPGPQSAFVTCPIFEVAYGGARGGGKTDGFLGEWLNHADQFREHAIGLVVRRTLVELTETIERSKAIFSRLGATWHTQEKMWRMANGARLRFAYLENDSDADNYQGHSYTRVYVEEAGNFPSPTPIFKLMATLRSGAGVACGIRLTFNPGGPGHHWVKARYWDVAPLGWQIITESFTNPFNGEVLDRQRIFIPARVTDNPYLGSDYIANLQMSGSPALVKAWLEGDFNIVAGAYFPEFGPQHIIAPFEIPPHWTRFGCYDHGTAKPYCFLWKAVADGEYFPQFPRGSIITYREDYGWSGKPNEGLWLTGKEIGSRIMDLNGGDNLSFSVADPSIFPSPKSRGISVAEDIMEGGLRLKPADNSRLAGWNQTRKRLKGTDGVPLIYYFKTCTHIIRTLPSLQHDPHNPNDCDTEGEDHAPDADRYGNMARPIVEVEQKPEVISTALPKAHEILDKHFSRPKTAWR